MNKSDEDKIIDICRKSDVSMIGIFGSTARGEATASSDIDLLIKLSKPKSLLALVKLERNLSEAIGKKAEEAGILSRAQQCTRQMIGNRFSGGMDIEEKGQIYCCLAIA
ncbi:MAG: nucleotidyltransferase domain-containing protein [Desulfobacterales bacterium]